MTYDFLKKAKEQPDLNDFCDYLKRPLIILEEIQSHYKKLQINKKVEASNLETYYKVDSILEKHLPEMVDNYCNFSFDYRNSKQIDINNLSITPKELLLKNLAKVIEEIELIEKEFNRNNSFNAVVQNKVLEKFGYQPELCLESNSIVKKNIELENKFDYDKFVETHQFKNPIPEVKKDLEINSEAVPSTIEKPKSKGSSSFLIEIILGLSFLTMLTIACFHFYKQSLDQLKANQFIQTMQSNIGSIQILYASRNNLEGLNNKLLIESGAVRPENVITPWGQDINIKPYTLNSTNDSFVMEIPLSGDNGKVVCPALLKNSELFNMVKFDDIVVKNNNNTTDVGNFVMQCMSGSHKKVSLIKQNY